MPNKIKNEDRVIGYLDKGTRIVATKHCFVIQIKEKMKSGEIIWPGRYFYSWLGDAIRGYAKYLAKKRNKAISSSESIFALLDRVAALERTIQEVGDRLNKAFEQKQTDPIEQALLNDSNDDFDEDAIENEEDPEDSEEEEGVDD